MVTITLYAKQKKRHRCTEQNFGLCRRRWGWDVSREQQVKILWLLSFLTSYIPWILIPLCSLDSLYFWPFTKTWNYASFFNFNNNDKIFILGLHCSPPPNPSVQFSSVTQLCPTLWDPMDCSMPGFSVHHQLQEFTQLMSIELVMPSNHLILCCPLLPPSIFSSIRVF